ncbi:MAG: hypothetical protein ACRD5B_01335 [Nitrososphaeraceae archaeon]
MSKIGSNGDITAEASVKYQSLSVNNGIKCFSFIAFYVVIIAVVAANQSDDATSLLAQSDIAGDRTLDDSNINLSSSMSQTSSPGESGQENISKSSTENQTSSPSLPILTGLSDNGTYEVELRWSSPLDIQSPAILSKNGFDMELLFLNASSQETTPETVPGDNSNLTMDFERSITSEVANLSTVEPIVPLESFDMTIYDDEGNELWSKMDQTLTAGRALMRVMLDPNYSGGITITVSDIKSPKTSSSNEKADESVRFTATVKGGQS